MMTKSQRKRAARTYNGTLAGATKIVVRRYIPKGAGESWPIGADVTKEAKTWPSVRYYIKHGHLDVDPAVDHRSVPRGRVPTLTAAKAAATQAAAPEAETPGAATEDELAPVPLGDLKATDLVGKIKASLEAADISVPSGTKKSALLQMVAAALE